MSQNYLRFLKDDFSDRQSRNPSFSLRAYARFLRLDPSLLCAIFKEKRHLSKQAAHKVAQRLELSPEQRRVFFESWSDHSAKTPRLSILKKKSRLAAKVLDEQMHYNVISEWEHFAILSLCRTKNFVSDERWIAERLGISPLQARFAIERLLATGLLERKAEAWVLTQSHVSTTNDVVALAQRESYRRGFEMAVKKLESVKLEDRYFGSLTVAVKKDKVLAAKRLLHRFQEDMCEFLEKGPCDEVYRLNLQFYPLTQLEVSDCQRK